MFPLDDDALLRLLKEDLPHGDLTTRSLGIGALPGVLTMRARGPMTVCGSEEAARIFALLGAEAELRAPTGQRTAAGETLLVARGRAEALHAGWKVAQTLTEWVSGIATSAAGIVDAARATAPGIVVACTRKPAPFTRALSLRAIVAGGAEIHRTGLSETVLLFPEHRIFGGADALAPQIARLRAACPERRIVVEVATREDALHAAEAGADVLQLEKFAPENVAATAETLGGWPGCLAAAGGINAANAAAYAATGAQVLVTSAPYYAKPADVAVTIELA
ncbi:ModD protein [Rhodovulum euryhalinum]|uniref:Putative pyrophosphorylase ModD n=1 Tax=Rhodovulum euryhalinum TaxID=35805 RepID=A0A4R2KL01_9RHOB|nr:ModD protein [Rhodovulum euryhalinum]TCO73252.1 molybdenum transport protein [Rhodovulum euryhalinum]